MHKTVVAANNNVCNAYLITLAWFGQLGILSHQGETQANSGQPTSSCCARYSSAWFNWFTLQFIPSCSYCAVPGFEGSVNGVL